MKKVIRGQEEIWFKEIKYECEEIKNITIIKNETDNVTILKDSLPIQWLLLPICYFCTRFGKSFPPPPPVTSFLNDLI